MRIRRCRWRLYLYPERLKDVTPEQRETLDKMIERLEEFDDVQTVYTNMKPEGGEEE